MLLLQALPTSIGVAAIAPALLLLWLVVAADERPGPPVRVWLAFVLGAASISLLGIARAPFAAILAVFVIPQVSSYLLSGLLGCASSPIFVGRAFALFVWRGFGDRESI